VIRRIGHVAVTVPYISDAVAFYESFIGLRVVERTRDSVYLSCNERHHELVLRDGRGGRAGLVHVGLEVEPGTIDDCVARALDAGAAAPRELSEPGVERAVEIAAPMGFSIKLFEGTQQVDAPDHVAGVPERFGHVNLTTPDVDGWGVFLQDGLGFRLSDRAIDAEGPIITWYHCPVAGADHHGIANTRSVRTLLHHIKWEYRGASEVVDVVDRYCDGDRTLVWGMGRHGVDRSLFAYVEDPAGLMNEVGLGMLTIDDESGWTGPADYRVDDPRSVNLWGTPIPERWLAHGIEVAATPVGNAA